MKKFYDRSKMLHYAASNDWDGEEWLMHTNMSVRGNDVYSYATKVAEINRKKQMLLITRHTYSMTTSNQISQLLRAFDHYERVFTFDFSVDEAWERVKRTVKEYTEDMFKQKENREYVSIVYDEIIGVIKFFGKGKKYLNSKTFSKLKDMDSKCQAIKEHKDKLLYEKRERERIKAEEHERKLRENTLAVITKLRPDLLNGKCTTFKDYMMAKEIRVPLNEFLKEFPNMDYDKETYFCFSYNDKDELRLPRYYTQDILENLIQDFKVREIHKYDWSESLYKPDILVYDTNTKYFKTSQCCQVDDSNGATSRLLVKLITLIESGASEESINDLVKGKHCGPFTIECWNYKEQFLRVGCHCFLLENLKEVLNDITKGGII